VCVCVVVVIQGQYIPTLEQWHHEFKSPLHFAYVRDEETCASHVTTSIAL
jgi:hypothetical protein